MVPYCFQFAGCHQFKICVTLGVPRNEGIYIFRERQIQLLNYDIDPSTTDKDDQNTDETFPYNEPINEAEILKAIHKLKNY